MSAEAKVNILEQIMVSVKRARLAWPARAGFATEHREPAGYFAKPRLQLLWGVYLHANSISRDVRRTTGFPALRAIIAAGMPAGAPGKGRPLHK